jgi:hypothetical protein
MHNDGGEIDGNVRFITCLTRVSASKALFTVGKPGEIMIYKDFHVRITVALHHVLPSSESQG